MVHQCIQNIQNISLVFSCPGPNRVSLRRDARYKKGSFLKLTYRMWIKFDCKKWIFCHVKHTTQHSKGKVEKHTKNSRTAVIKFTRNVQITCPITCPKACRKACMLAFGHIYSVDEMENGWKLIEN